MSNSLSLTDAIQSMNYEQFVDVIKISNKLGFTAQLNGILSTLFLLMLYNPQGKEDI